MISIQQDLLFLNLSRKAQVVGKRFELFTNMRSSHLKSQLVGFYPSRDLYSESTWSVYEIQWDKNHYTTVIWDYYPPAERNLPQQPYFEMRPETTTLAYRPVHHYKTDHMLISAIRKLHPKLVSFIKTNMVVNPISKYEEG